MKGIIIKDIKRKTTIPMSTIKKAAAYANATIRQTKSQTKTKAKSKVA